MSTYVVNKTINSEGRRLNFIDVGIHDDVILIAIEFKMSPNGNPFLVLTFEKDGKKLTHTEYEPKDKDGKILEDKKLNQIKRLKHIATKYIKEDDFDFESNSFEEFCQTMIKKLTGKFEGKKMRVKVIYSNKNYTSLPKYVPFIESMDIPKEKSTLEISSIDKMTKDAPDKSEARPNPYKDLETADVVPQNEEDQLPF
jgi:hypothetical protein